MADIFNSTIGGDPTGLRQMYGLQNRYDYSHLSPELAQAERTQDQRQLMANAIMQGALKPRQGKMVGRLYQKAHIGEGLGQIGEALIGGMMQRDIAEKREEAGKAEQQRVADAILKYKEGTEGRDVEEHALHNIATPDVTEFSSLGKLTDEARPDFESLTSARLPMKPQSLMPVEGVTGQYAPTEQKTPYTPEVTYEGTPAVEGPVNPAMYIPPSQGSMRLAAMQGLSDPNPQVRGMVKFLEDERRTDETKSLDRELKRETNLQNMTRDKAMLDNTMAMKMMTLRSMDQRSEEALQLRKEITEGQRQSENLTRQLQATIATGHDATAKWGVKYAADTRQMLAKDKEDWKVEREREAALTLKDAGIAGAESVITMANKILHHPGLSRAVGLTGAVPSIKGSQAYGAQALIDTLKYKIGFSALQDMRNSNKTGGGLGSIAVKELEALQNSIDSLDPGQGLDQFRASLTNIIDEVRRLEGRIETSYSRRFGDHGSTKPSGSSEMAPQSGNTTTDDLVNKYLGAQ